MGVLSSRSKLNEHSSAYIYLFIYFLTLLEEAWQIPVSHSFLPTASNPQQWQTGSVGQTSGAFEGARPQSSHFLPDGTDVGYPCWLPEEPTVPLSGSYPLFSCDLHPLYIPSPSTLSRTPNQYLVAPPFCAQNSHSSLLDRFQLTNWLVDMFLSDLIEIGWTIA